jgi:thiosulfate reductase cytochrome b subunit
MRTGVSGRPRANVDGAWYYHPITTMASSTYTLEKAASPKADVPRHSVLVRITHWLTTVCFFALLLTGMEIVVSHPRFYWGETGNPMMPSLFNIPIPASRPWVNTGYSFVLPDQNGWSRNLHFEAAWLVIITGLIYVIAGLRRRHFQNNLLPEREGFNWRSLSRDILAHLSFRRPHESEARSYNVVQRLTYLLVVFFLFPLVVWTGLAMSPALVSVFPILVTSLGGHQSARTIHFFVSLLLSAFILIHVVMVWRAGFRNRMRAMITGRVYPRNEQV